MARFEFRREGRVWLEHSGTYYLLHTTKDVTFSQTFQEKGIRRKTLHSSYTQNNDTFVEGSSITEANPADFSFTLYMIDDEGFFYHQHKPLDLLLQTTQTIEGVDNFNLYFVYSDYSPETYYKIEKCVFTSGSFNIPRNGLMTVNLSGTGSKLTREEASFGQTPDANYKSNPSFAISKEFDVKFNTGSGYVLQDRILGASIEVQNEVVWTPSATLHESLGVDSEANTIFPTKYTLNARNIGGSIQQYTDAEVSDGYIQSWEDLGIRIQAGLASNNYQLETTVQNARFTTRTNFGDVFTQNYDFRATLDNTIFTYT